MTHPDWREIARLCRHLREQLDLVTVYAARRAVSDLALEVLGELGEVERLAGEVERVKGRTPATDAALLKLQEVGLVKGEGERLHVTPLGWKVLEAIRGAEPREDR